MKVIHLNNDTEKMKMERLKAALIADFWKRKQKRKEKAAKKLSKKE